MTEIVVNQKKCIGCGTCTILNPKTFKIGKNGKAEVINNSQKLDAKVKGAIESCPAKAISAKS